MDYKIVKFLLQQFAFPLSHFAFQRCWSLKQIKKCIFYGMHTEKTAFQKENQTTLVSSTLSPTIWEVPGDSNPFQQAVCVVATLFQSLMELNIIHIDYSTPTGLTPREQLDEDLIYQYSCSHTESIEHLLHNIPYPTSYKELSNMP